MPEAKSKLRAITSSTKEVYVDVNDLIIELMMESGDSSTEAERKVYQKVIQRLTDLRDKTHATSKQ